MSRLTELKPVLEGTAYTGNDTVRVIVAGHPLRSEKIDVIARAGDTIADMIEQANTESRISDLASAIVVYVDGHVVEKGNWSRVRPKAGTTIVLRAVAEGPLLAGIGAIFSAISAATASISGFIGGLGLLGKVIGVGLSLGASFLLNALFPVAKPQISDDADDRGKTAYSVSGSRNSAAPWEAIPVVLGSHRVTPFYAALPYTESTSDDQFWRGVFAWCYGPARISDIRIGETPIGQFQDYQIETTDGYKGENDPTLYVGQPVEEPLSIDLEQKLGWVTRTTATGVTEISADIVFPSGVYAMFKKSGTRGAYTVHFEAHYRPVGTEGWAPFPQILEQIRSIDPVRRTMRVGVPIGQYEVRIRRVMVDDADVENDSYSAISKSVLTAIRGMRPGKAITFGPGLVKTAIRIRASQQLNGSLDSLNGIVNAHVWAAFDGTQWNYDRHSRNPADLIRHVLQGPANSRPVPDALLDLTTLEAFWRYCNMQGFTYDAVITSPRSVFDMVMEICSAARAVPIWKDGKWSVTWDQPESGIVQLFTPRNSWGFDSTREYVRIPHGFRVRFVNREKGFVDDERIVFDDGYDANNATIFEGMEFPGVTDPNLVWRHGRFHLAQLRLRPETITLNTDWENLVVTRGDRVRVQHDVMLLGQISGRITRHANGEIFLDETVTVEAGKRYTLRRRTNDLQSVSTTFDTLPAGEYDRLPWTGSAPEAGELYSWGEAGRETAVYRVLSIETNPDLTARLTLVDDAPAISNADRGAIPAYQSNVTRPVNPFTLPPINMTHSQEAYLSGETWLARITIGWTSPRSGQVSRFEVAMFDRDAGFWRELGSTGPAQTTFTANDLDEGIYVFRVRAIFDDGAFSSYLQSEDISTTSLLDPPGDVTGFNVDVIGDLTTLSWNPVANAATYELRYSKEGTGVTWNAATPLIQSVSGTSVQVPSMTGSFLIKAAKANGVRSRNAVIITSDIASLAGLNVVELLTEEGFTGTRDRVELTEAGTLRLRAKNVIASWTSLAEVKNLADGVMGPGSASKVEPEGFYVFAKTVDTSGVYTSRLTGSVKAEGADLTNLIGNWPNLASIAFLDNSKPEDWRVELQYRTTDKAPSANDWSAWKRFVVGDVTARAFQFRLRLTGMAMGINDYSTITPIVHSVAVSVDMPDRTASGNDIYVPPQGKRIIFDRPFFVTPAIATSAQSLTTGDWQYITDKNSDGFTIRFYNAANQPTEKTFDYVAKGYGTKQ